MPPPPVPAADGSSSSSPGTWNAVALQRDVREALFEKLAAVAVPSELKANPTTTLPDSTPATPMLAPAQAAGTFSPRIGGPESPPLPAYRDTYPSVAESRQAEAATAVPIVPAADEPRPFDAKKSAASAAPLPAQQTPPKRATVAACASPSMEDVCVPLLPPSPTPIQMMSPQPQRNAPLPAARTPVDQQRPAWDDGEAVPIDFGDCGQPIASPASSFQQQQGMASSVSPQSPAPFSPQSIPSMTPLPVSTQTRSSAAPLPPPKPAFAEEPQQQQTTGGTASSGGAGSGSTIPNDVQRKAELLGDLKNLRAMGVTIPVDVSWDTPVEELERLSAYADEAFNDKMGTDVMFMAYVRFIDAVEMFNDKLDPIGHITGTKTSLKGASAKILDNPSLREEVRVPLKMIYRKYFKTKVLTEAGPIVQLGLTTWNLLQSVNAENVLKMRRRRRRRRQAEKGGRGAPKKGADDDSDDDDDDDVSEEDCDSNCDAPEATDRDYVPGDEDFDPCNEPDDRPVSKKPPTVAAAAVAAPAHTQTAAPVPAPKPQAPKPRPSPTLASGKVAAVKPRTASPASAKPAQTCDSDETCSIVPAASLLDEDYTIEIPMSPSIMGSPKPAFQRANK